MAAAAELVCHGGVRVALDPGLVLAVAGLLAGVGNPPVPAVADVAADEHHWAEPGDSEHVDLVQEIGQRHAEDHRDNGRQQRERTPLRLAGRSGQGEPVRLAGWQQPGRPVELEPGTVARGAQRGVRPLIRGQVQQRRADGDLRAGPPARGRFQRLAVQQDLHAGERLDLAALRIDLYPQGQRRDGRVVDLDIGLPGAVLAADVELPAGEPVQRALHLARRPRGARRRRQVPPGRAGLGHRG